MEKPQLISQIGRLFVGTPTEYQKLMESLAEKSVPELEKVATQLQIAAANREKTKLDLVRHGGLAPTDRNWVIIDIKLGTHYTFQQFRDAIARDAAFKQSLEWEREPFAQVVQQEQQNKLTEQKHFALFVSAANAATAQGVNIAPNEANYRMVREVLGGMENGFSLANIMAVLFRRDIEFATNDPTVANELMQQCDQEERDRLADIVVDSMRAWRIQGAGGIVVRDEYGRDQALKKIKQLSLPELHEKARVVEHNRRLASKSPSDLKAQAEQDRQEQHRNQGGVVSGKPPLPEVNQYGERIDSAYLVRISNTNLDLFKRLVLKHGYQNVTNRIQGRG
jgi:hypothetical protein